MTMAKLVAYRPPQSPNTAPEVLMGTADWVAYATLMDGTETTSEATSHDAAHQLLLDWMFTRHDIDWNRPSGARQDNISSEG
jgi:hypothetical protein